MLHEEAARVHAGAVAAVPAIGAVADGLLQTRNGARDVLALLHRVELEMLHPAPTMRADVVPGIADGGRRERVALQRQGATEDGQRQAAFREQAHQAPEADATAILKH